jgi:DNA-3-methyladenine glycosylase II
MSPHLAIAPLTTTSLLRGVDELCTRDGAVAIVVDRFGPPPLWARPGGFSTLVRMVLEQQVSLASGRAAYDRLQTAAGGRVTPHRVAALSEADLRRAGLTRQKASYCHGLALAIVGGDLDLRAVAQLEDDAARTHLQTLPGIGPWTADIYLLMALRRPDVWPDGDLALIKGLQRLRRLRRMPTVERARRLTASWSPWRAVGARVLWHLYLSERRS